MKKVIMLAAVGKAESGFCRPVVMLDLTACIPGKLGFDRILTGVLQ